MANKLAAHLLYLPSSALVQIALQMVGLKQFALVEIRACISRCGM